MAKVSIDSFDFEHAMTAMSRMAKHGLLSSADLERAMARIKDADPEWWAVEVIEDAAIVFGEDRTVAMGDSKVRLVVKQKWLDLLSLPLFPYSPRSTRQG